ncbi:MAG: cytochrome c [Desulfuromonadales bacterium]|nr:cytochrome c [Desulfuromonadales bacterium]
MKNWKTVVMITLVLAAFITTSALAVDGGNSRKGKHLFKKTCKTCHGAGGEGGEISPKVKTMAQWDRHFKKAAKKHPGDVFKKTPKQDLKDINQFLYDSAADSLSPETCG